MEEKILFNERKELFQNAIQMKKNKRTPMLSNFWTWKILDTRYKLSEALSNYDIMEEVVSDFHKRYQFDAYMDLGTRNPKRISDALGNGFHRVDDKNESITVLDHTIMARDEYKEFVKNPQEFYWTKALRRCVPDLTLEQLEKVAMEFVSFGQFMKKMDNKFKNEFQCLLLAPVFIFPFELFFSTLRGIKEISNDLRRCKTELIAAMDVQYKTSTFPAIKFALASDTSDYFADTYTVFIGHSILSEKQFEEIYWPYLKPTIEQFTAHNKTMFIMCESSMLRFSNLFQDISKGSLLIQLEQDNIFEIRKKLPNISFAGGMTTDLLGSGTVQQCVDYAKKLIDELGEGYVFSTNKMMSFRNDCKRENLLAVTDFVLNYKH